MRVPDRCMALTVEVGATERPIQKQDGKADWMQMLLLQRLDNTAGHIWICTKKPGTFIAHMMTQ